MATIRMHVPCQCQSFIPHLRPIRHHTTLRQQIALQASRLSQSVTTASDVSQPHISVLLQPILDIFQPLKIRTYVDGTLGAGGHACAVMEAHQELETLVGFDVDPTAHQIAGQRLNAVRPSNTQIHLVKANYRDLKQHLQRIPVPQHITQQHQQQPQQPAGTGESLYGKVDAMLLDLGVSSMQIDTADRGFSFMKEGPIDMRMDPHAALSAEEVINTWSENELGRIIRDYGEEKMWRQVARRIVAARASAPIRTTSQLVDAIGQTIPSAKGSKKGDKGGKRIHPATRTFQALRIAVNDEINKLKQTIPDAIGAMAPGGMLAIISFHSLEDRLVKQAFAGACGKPLPEEEHLLYGPDKFRFLDELQARAVARPVTRKAVVASEEEMQMNPRSRSAKLRVIQRL